MLRNPQESTRQVGVEASHIKLFLRNVRFHHSSGFPNLLGTVPRFSGALAWARNMSM